MHKVKITESLAKLLEKEQVYFRPTLNVDIPKNFILQFYDGVNLGNHVGYLYGCQPGVTYAAITIGAYSYTHSPLDAGCVVGNYCSIAGGVRIRGFNHPIHRFTTAPITYHEGFCTALDTQMQRIAITADRPMPIIKNDVWIGGGVQINRGITLDTGCIIASRSVVVKSVPPYAIVGGNPAKIIRYRFPQGYIRELLDSRWFTYDLANLDIRGDASIGYFLDAFYKARAENILPPLRSRKLIDIMSVCVGREACDRNYAAYGEFIQKIHEMSPHCVIIIASKDAHTNWTCERDLLLNQFGLRLAPEKKYRYSYIALIDEGHVVYEAAEADKVIDVDYELPGGHRLHIHSAGFRADDFQNLRASIFLDDDDVCVNQRGLNIAIYDKSQKRFIQSVCFDSYYDFRKTVKI